jgi:hypothetical protein
VRGELAIGAIVAFISGIGRLSDPWGDLVNYFREVSVTRVKFRLLEAALSTLAYPIAPFHGHNRHGLVPSQGCLIFPPPYQKGPVGPRDPGQYRPVVAARSAVFPGLRGRKLAVGRFVPR